MTQYEKTLKQFDEEIYDLDNLIDFIINTQFPNLKCSSHYDEVVSQININITNALRRYNPSKGKLRQVVTYQIKFGCLDYLRNVSKPKHKMLVYMPDPLEMLEICWEEENDELAEQQEADSFGCDDSE